MMILSWKLFSFQSVNHTVTCHQFHMTNDRSSSLVTLLTYSDTEHALLDSRRWFDVSGLVVNRSFVDEYQINFNEEFVRF